MCFSSNADSMAVERSDLNGSYTEQGSEERSSLQLASPTVVAFIGRTQRGPLNEPTLIRSVEAFRQVFGGSCPFSYLPQSISQYFEHGGAIAVVVRVTNRATRATIDVPAGPEVLRLQAREPGSHEFLRVSVDYDRIENDPNRFNLVVQRLSRPKSELVEDQEFFQAVSVESEDSHFVVDALAASKLIRLRTPIPRHRPEATRARHPGEPIPYLELSSPGSDGEELTDYDVVGSREEGTGLFALDRVGYVDLLCIPAHPGRDFGHTTFLAAERYCERRRAMLIWDPSWSWESTASALLGVRESCQASPNALTYFPRLRARDGSDRHFKGIPACGAVAGLLAQADRNSVRGMRAAQNGILRRGFTPFLELDPRQAALLNRHGINVFRRAAGGAFALQGNVSLAGPHAISRSWQSLERRRLALFIVGRIERLVRAALLGNDDAHWATLQRQVKRFLLGLYAAGALAGESSEQAYFVWPTRPDAVESPVFRFGFALERPGEFVAFEAARSTPASGLHVVAALEGVQLTG
jgi:Bacteriophage tail sheath protein